MKAAMQSKPQCVVQELRCNAKALQSDDVTSWSSSKPAQSYAQSLGRH